MNRIQENSTTADLVTATLPIRLDKLVDTLPRHWREFQPSFDRRYVSHVREILSKDLQVMDADDPAFEGFAGVPRYFHPTADAEALALSLELICWYFYFDDPFDDGDVGASGHVLVERMVSVLETGRLPPSPTGCERLCLRFRNRALVMSGDRLNAWRRFIGQCADWVGSILPINRRIRSNAPTLKEYRRLRLVNVGILPEYALNEIIMGLDLGEDFVDSDNVQRYGQLAALVIAYFNDVYSYQREVRSGTQFNSLELRMLHSGLSLAEAFDQQVNAVRTMITEMLQIERRLSNSGQIGLGSGSPSEKRRAQTRYVEGIRSIVVGNHLWSLSDGRYHSPDSPFKELREWKPDRRRRASVVPYGSS